MDLERLHYLLHYFEYDLDVYIRQVLEDDEKDPHYSAVTLFNLLTCFLSTSKDIDPEFPFEDIKSYVQSWGYTEEEFRLLEKKRALESRYYTGKQF